MVVPSWIRSNAFAASTSMTGEGEGVGGHAWREREISGYTHLAVLCLATSTLT